MTVEKVKAFVRFCGIAVFNIGFVPTCKWIFSTAQLNLSIPMPSLVSVWPRSLMHPVRLRARTSDAFIFRQIMIEEEYRPLRNLQVATMLDLGANIGLASAWFLSNFPGARVFAVEADEDNCARCEENLGVYGGRVDVLHGAAWSSRAILSLCRGTHKASIRVQETPNDAGEIRVQGWNLSSLIEMSGFSEVDLLKIDIEGAEEAIFSADVSGWLPRVRNLCIELHGEKCRKAFFGALTDYDFDHSISGELDICTNLRPRMKT